MKTIAAQLIVFVGFVWVCGCGAAADKKNESTLKIVKPQAAKELSCEADEIRATCIESKGMMVGSCQRWGMAGCGEKAIYFYDGEAKKWKLDPESRPAKASKPDESADGGMMPGGGDDTPAVGESAPAAPAASDEVAPESDAGDLFD